MSSDSDQIQFEIPDSETWEKVQRLFDTMAEADNPEAVLAQEGNRVVAAVARRLFENHQRAAQAGFLEAPFALIREATAVDIPVFAPGQMLAGRFAVERLLGHGGMGEVYLAYDQRLSERIAIKTIRRHLIHDAAVRSRFFLEVRNARRVTHRNVCRIFDLFEEGEAPFFSMEYLEGCRLSEWLRQGMPARRVARRLALELAEGLHAAHRNEILHCDFKSVNVVLTGPASEPRPVVTDFGLARALTNVAKPESLCAGTLDYMAPELLRGEPASVRSDIYAFGKVAAELMPGSKVALICASERGEDRPVSLDSVIRKLQGGIARRYWVLGALAVAATGAGAYELTRRPRLALPPRKRLAFNGFRPGEAQRAVLLRDLLMMALGQSLLLTVVPDQKIRSVLHQLSYPTGLPAERSHLLSVALKEDIALVVEGTVAQKGNAIRFLLQIFQPGIDKPVLEVAEQANEDQIVYLAERVALQVRRETGESADALKSANAPLDQLTSPFPDAVEFYFRGLKLYETGEAEAAIVWFDQAVRVDHQFALAHLCRGIAMAARFAVINALPSYEAALALRQRVSERERLWIESQYYNIVCDFVSALERCRRLVALYPEQAIFQRQTAFAYAIMGRPRDALAHNRSALEIDSSSDNNMSELIVNHAQANLCDEALSLYARFRAAGYTTTLFDWGAGLAWLGKGDHEKARQSFESMGRDAKRDRWARVCGCAPLILEGRFAEARAALESDLAWDNATGEQNHRLTRLCWLGNLECLMDSPWRALSRAQDLIDGELSPALIQPIREGGLLALDLDETALAQKAVDRLREIERRWPSTYTRGVRAHVEGVLFSKAGDSDRAEGLLREAGGLWQDPPFLSSYARALIERAEFGQALSVCESLAEQQGWIFKHFFPGLSTLARIHEARCLVQLSRFNDARRVYERFCSKWLTASKQYRMVRAVHEELHQLSNLFKGTKND